MSTVLSKLPRQRLSYNSKGKQWRKDNLDYADKYSFYNNERVRNTIKNRVVNLNLYNGKLDRNDIANTLNPHGLKAEYIPENIPHHPILVPKIDVLVGEEINRNFDWLLTVTNPDAISMKEKDKAKVIKQRLIELMKQSLSKEDLEAEMNQLRRFLKYEYQDLRERSANHLLRHYYEEENFDKKFNEGFKDALIMGEEIYQCDIVSNEPVLHKLNPLKVHTIRSGNSNKIEDSDLIIIEDHWSPGRIIDTFHEELKPKDIDYITNYTDRSGSGGKYTIDDENHLLIRDAEDALIDSYLDIGEINGHHFSSDYVDSVGNIRVLRVYWRSLKKLKKVKYYDEFGQEQTKLMSEEYIIDKGMGEEEEILWVNEWWEGTKIGKEVYLSMKPRTVQYNRLNNPSRCHSGIVGEIYNTNQGRAVSLVDRMKNYQYLYDVIWDRLNKAIAKNLGKILLLDIALVPDGWEPEKWVAQATNMGLGIVDSFKEGDAGAAQGKLAGPTSGQQTRAIDLETGNYIQQHVNLLEFIKNEMAEIAGISRQREGNVANRETKGGIERAVTQSSHITEWWFMKHEDVKKRVLLTFLDTAKIALKGRNKKIQYIADDFTKVILDIDGDDIASCDYGLTVTSSHTTKKLKDSLEMLAQAFMQNGGSYGTVIDIMTSPTIADMRRKIEFAEEDMKEQAAAADKAKNEIEQAKLAQEQKNKDDDRALEKYKVDQDNQTKLQIEMMKANEKAGQIEPVEDDTLDYEKLNLDREKVKNDLLVKMKTLDQNMAQHNDKMQREDKKIAIQKSKPAASSGSK